MKVLIIGLDGATWEVLDDFVLENHMPNLKKLKNDGYSGVLYSTQPPTTSTAWTTFSTGCYPVKHGILGYQRYSFQENSLSVLNSTICRVPTLWQQLSRQRYKIVGINVPWTYPCQEINGVMVAGFGIPGPDSEFTYPLGFKSELLNTIPQYEVMAKCDWSSAHDFEEFRSNIEQVEHSFKQKLEAAKLSAKKVDWDIMMVEFQDIDVLHHNIWSFLDKRSRDQYPQHRDRLYQMFEKLDKIIGELLDYSAISELLTLVISDHGGGRLIGEIRPNILLHKWGYLYFKSPLTRVAGRQIRHWHRKFNPILYGKRKIENLQMRQPKELSINWKRSKAVVLHTATNGYLYINYKERQASGSVESPSEFNNIIKDLKERFSCVEDPVTERPLFTRIATPQELYGDGNIAPEYVGDLILVPQDGYDIRTSVSRKKGYLYLTPDRSIKGTHRYEGIYILFGNKVKPATGKIFDMADIAPTIYAALGAKLPTYLDGRVMHEAFVENLNVEYLKSNGPRGFEIPAQQELPLEEQAAIEKHLAELGYL